MTYLISPFIDDRHINIIYKHCHLSTSRRAICTPHSLINIALNSSLQWGMWKKVKLKRKNCSTIPLHLLIYKQDQISFIMNCYLYPSPLHQILSKKKMLQSNTYIFYWKQRQKKKNSTFEVSHMWQKWTSHTINQLTRYDYNLTIMKSPKSATDNRFKK